MQRSRKRCVFKTADKTVIFEAPIITSHLR